MRGQKNAIVFCVGVTYFPPKEEPALSFAHTDKYGTVKKKKEAALPNRFFESPLRHRYSG